MHASCKLEKTFGVGGTFDFESGVFRKSVLNRKRFTFTPFT